MGTCASQQSNVVCQPEIGLATPRPPTPTKALPDSFHPELEASEIELLCRKTVKKLVSRNETVHNEVAELLTKWDNSGQLSEIEAHALSISPTQAASISELSEALTNANAKYMTSFKNDATHTLIAKAYIIYYWIATNLEYDIEKWQSCLDGSIMHANVQPASILAQRKAVSSGYSCLYQALALKAGLEVEVVKGNVKTWKSLSIETEATGFTPNITNTHNWNTVKLSNGAWFPVDCTYGSGCIDPNIQFSREFTRYYFAPLPQHLILTHWPLSKNWQLLKNPISLKDYQDLIPLASPVSAQGILPQLWCERIPISEGTNHPAVTVRLYRKPGLSFSTSVTRMDVSSISHNAAGGSSHVLENHIFVQETKDEICFRVAIPWKGRFALNIYVGRESDASALNSRLALSYIIECDMDPKCLIGYPILFTKASKAFGFELVHWGQEKSYSPENETGTLDITFRAQPDLQFNHYLVPGTVKTTGDSQKNEAHSTMMVSKVEGDESQYKLHVVFPSKGWWSVYLWAAKRNSTSGETALMKYQVYAKTGLERACYPCIYDSCVTLDIVDPISPSGSDVHSIAFRSLKNLDFQCFLTHQASAGDRYEEYIKVGKLSTTTAENEYKLQIVFPKPGKWYVHVFSKEHGATEDFHQLFGFPAQVEHCLQHKHFAVVDTDYANAQGITLIDNGLLTFPDNGEPLLYHFEAPKSMEFMHILKPYNSKDTSNIEEFPLSHCTYLSTAKSAASQIARCTLRAVFPSSGHWTVEVFSKCISTNEFGFVFRITVDVTKPIIHACFPKLHHSFYKLGLQIPDESMLYNTVCEANDFELPFQAPDDVTFRWSMQLVGSDKQQMQHAFVHHCYNSEPNRIFHLLFTELGEWTACLYGKQKANISEDDLPLLDLRIKATKSTTEKSFPQIYEAFRNEFGLNLDKSHLPLVSRALNIPCTLTMHFLSHSGVKFWHDATLMDTGNKYITRMISNNTTGVNELTAELTEIGKWVISLYAQHTDSVDDEWIPVMQHTAEIITM